MDYSLLAHLSNAPGVSGREEKVREIVFEQFSRITREIRIDAMGNLIAHVSGKGPRVALVAHMDEIGFIVSKIEEKGFVRVMPVGGVDPLVFWAQEVVVHGRRELPGVVGTVPPHLKPSSKNEKTPPIEEGFIDLGLPSSEVRELASVGDPVVFASRFRENESSVFAKALDDRLGLFVLIESVRCAKSIGCDLYLIASVQEEYGLRGAGPAVFSVAPEVALALEGTVASDVPGVKLAPNVAATEQGKGPEIRIADRRMISHRPLADFIARIARESDIPHQVIVKNFGTTDASAGQTAGPGVKTCAVSVPVRYIHAPVSIARKSDIAQTISLTSAFLERAAELGQLENR